MRINLAKLQGINMKQLYVVIIVLLLAIFTSLGWFLGQRSNLPTSVGKMGIKDALKPISNVTIIDGVTQDGTGKTIKYWYDPMVPDKKFDKPGKSPFMDMQLEPKYITQSSNGDEAGVAISSQIVQNLGIRLEKVKTKAFGESLTAVGRIVLDERHFYAVQTRVPGFVERLFVRAVGDPVTKGQKIAEIYAPELLAAQQEYLALRKLNIVDPDNALKDAARSRLKLLGMSESEVVAISKADKASSRFGVYAPASGVLTELGVREGGQLMTGSSLMQISDLSQVWFIAEVPERDSARLKTGIVTEVQLQSLPNETVKGKVAYLYPMLNETSRTLQVRIELSNKSNRLHPGMYGTVLFTGQTHESLSVPTESIIATGKRKIVILKEKDGYRPVEVTTGLERDNTTEVLKGLAEGEQVVISGQFLIDSEASLSGVLDRLSQQEKVIEHNTKPNSDDIQHKEMIDNKKKIKEVMPKGFGKVVDVDAKSNHVTLNHEPIAMLGWPSMTMGFKVRDSQQLTNLKAGDDVEFDLKAETPKNPSMPAQYMIERVKKVTLINDHLKGSNP